MGEFAYNLTLRPSDSTIDALTHKLGENPFGMPQERWPNCRQSGTPMTFLGQFRLDNPLDMSSRFRMAYAFMCQTYDSEMQRCEHETSELESGHTDVVLVEHSTSTPVESPVPPLREFRIELQEFTERAVSWEETYALNRAIEEIDLTDDNLDSLPPENDRLGGRPSWFQAPNRPEDTVGRPMRFLAQIDGCELADHEPRIEHFVGDGMFFVFFSEDGTGRVVWQAT